MLAPLLKLKPGIITNNRLGRGHAGDTETPEQRIPATGFKDRDWETCMTINNTWGYKSYDTNWKSTELLVRNLVDIASKGGNYLLNVGPTAEGLIPQPSITRLKEMGVWLQKNGAAIYGTTASPFKNYSFNGRCTVKGSTMYLHVFDWPRDGVKLTGLQTPVASASFVADGAPATISTTKDAKGTVTLTIMPPAACDPIATVVAIKLAGPIEIVQTEPVVDAHAVSTAATGVVVRCASDNRGAIKLPSANDPNEENGRW